MARSAARHYFIFWGTYTSADTKPVGGGPSEGIYVSRFDSATGSVKAPELAAKTSDPSYLVIHPNRRYLYAVNEEVDRTGKTPGGVSAFSIDRKTGRLTLLNRVSSKGGMPCHISTDRTGAVVAVANWSTGSTATFPVRRDGSLGEAAGFQQHAGDRSGVQPGEAVVQPHCHSVNATPDNRFLVATDTGLNKVFVYRLDAAKATIVPHEPPFLGLQHQANPRQLIFHPDRRFAYVANESGPGCTMLLFNGDRGVFQEGAVTRTVPDGHTGRVTPAEIGMHPDGTLLFVSNRGHDSIATLKIDRTTGSHTFVDTFQPGGSTPRSFSLDPTGRFLFAMMQRSGWIVPCRVDQGTGKLSLAGDKLNLSAPVCAKFLEVD